MSLDGERESPERIRQGAGVEKVKVIPMTVKQKERMKGFNPMRMSRRCRLLKQLRQKKTKYAGKFC